MMIKPFVSCSFKNSPNDFVVKEYLSDDLLTDLKNNQTPQKEHLWIYIKKINLSTQEAITLLAKWSNIPVKDIGYSGLKDNYAETYQWISLRLAKPTEDFNIFIQKNLKPNQQLILIEQYYYSKKINKGTHKFNYFKLILKDIKINPNINQETINSELKNLQKIGFPNYFGQQRFGKNDDNIGKCFEFFNKLKPNTKVKLTHRTAFLVSVARSLIFNEILQKRVENNTWHTAIEGDIFNLTGSNSVFSAEIDDKIIQRIALGDISPTAPLYGINGKHSTSLAKQIETDILTKPEFHCLKTGLEILQIKQHRRALRVFAKDLIVNWLDNNNLVLEFYLPTGSFATSLLDNICQNAIDRSGMGELLEN